jgi:chromosome partitioning protein
MTAKIITVFNQKGGCGKTVISMSLGGTLGLRGFRVLIVDMDDQGTATRWASQSDEGSEFPAMISNLSAMKGSMHREVRKHLEDYDFIVIDCPPSAESPAASSAMLISDIALVPIKPAPADIWASVAAKRLAIAARIQNENLVIRMVPNEVARNTNLARQTIEMLEEDPDVPVTQTWIGTRNAFRECQLIGATVHALGASASVAIEEVESLVDEVLQILEVQKVPAKRKAA